MTRFEAHLKQANSNLDFLGKVNAMDPSRYDWQVTIGFYAALHLVNGYLCNYGVHYRSHHDVKQAINPHKTGSATKLPAKVYGDYQALFRLSRRARYLLDETITDTTNVAHTSEKHLAKAMRRLDGLLAYFEGELEEFAPLPISIACDRLAGGGALAVIRAQRR